VPSIGHGIPLVRVFVESAIPGWPTMAVTVPQPGADLNPYDFDLRNRLHMTLAYACPWQNRQVRRSS